MPRHLDKGRRSRSQKQEDYCVNRASWSSHGAAWRNPGQGRDSTGSAEKKKKQKKSQPPSFILPDLPSAQARPEPPEMIIIAVDARNVHPSGCASAG